MKGLVQVMSHSVPDFGQSPISMWDCHTSATLVLMVWSQCTSIFSLFFLTSSIFKSPAIFQLFLLVFQDSDGHAVYPVDLPYT
jgi:hypothetical protein